ncbi:MAG: MmgE/PrpD family protein [Pseudomonadota bacterium]
MGITDKLIEFAQAEPPETALAVMRLSLLDWAVCGIAGARIGDFAGFSGFPGDGGHACFDGRARDAAGAALANGTFSHALDFDDTHFDHIGHPSVAVIPAALTMAEREGASMEDMLAAALIGAEASVAVGLWLGRSHYQAGYHQTATAGAFGATLTAARLLGVGPDKLRHAVGLCSTTASGLKSQFGTMGKPLNAGLAARAGVEAALWADGGMTSADDIEAFGATHHGEGHDMDLPGPDWRMERVSHKFHACCHGLHAALEAIRGMDLAAANAIRIMTHPRWMSVCNIAAPRTGLEAKFSYRFVTAMAAKGLNTSDIGAFSDETARRADLAAIRDRVTVVADDSLTETQARVEADGQVAVFDLSDPLPMPERAARVRQKAEALIGPAAGPLQGAIDGNDLSAFVRIIEGGQ